MNDKRLALQLKNQDITINKNLNLKQFADYILVMR